MKSPQTLPGLGRGYNVSMITWMERVTLWLKRVVTQPLQELDRWQRATRGAYDLARFGARQLQHDRAPEMAAALAFRTLFGLLPVLVVTSVLVKALDMQQNFLEPLNRLFEFWGLGNVRILLPSAPEGQTITLANWLNELMRQAENVNVAAIGWVGVGLTIYAAISLVVTIEECFNVIYRAPQGRRWTRRVPLYWFLLTISPVIVVFGSYLNGRVEQLLDRLEGTAWLSVPVSLCWSVAVIWALMFVVYVLFPNTVVHARAALIGSLVSALLLEFGKRSLGFYLQNALSINQLYGSLGLIPLFMFWVYLMWLAVLFGLQVSATLQHLHGRQIAEYEQQCRESAMNDPSIVLVLMQQIGRRFQQGQTTQVAGLGRRTNLSEPVVEKLVEALIEEELIHRVASAESHVALCRPPESIPLARLLKIAFQLVERDGDSDAARAIVEQFRASQISAVEDRSLLDLLGDDTKQSERSLQAGVGSATLPVTPVSAASAAPASGEVVTGKDRLRGPGVSRQS